MEIGCKMGRVVFTIGFFFVNNVTSIKACLLIYEHMASQECRAVCEKESVVRVHHVYKVIWTLVIGEEREVKTEEENNYDQHTVAVVKDELLIGHMPCLVAEVSWFFLR